MTEGILIGLTTALSFQNIFMVMIGCFFGTIIGMLPGLGPMGPKPGNIPIIVPKKQPIITIKIF